MLWTLCALNPSCDSPQQLPAGALGAIDSTLYLTLAQLAWMPSSLMARSTARPPAEHTGLPPKVLKCSRCAITFAVAGGAGVHFIQEQEGSAREGGAAADVRRSKLPQIRGRLMCQSIPAAGCTCSRTDGLQVAGCRARKTGVGGPRVLSEQRNSKPVHLCDLGRGDDGRERQAIADALRQRHDVWCHTLHNDCSRGLLCSRG